MCQADAQWPCPVILGTLETLTPLRLRAEPETVRSSVALLANKQWAPRF